MHKGASRTSLLMRLCAEGQWHDWPLPLLPADAPAATAADLALALMLPLRPCMPWQVKDCLQYAEDHGQLMKSGTRQERVLTCLLLAFAALPQRALGALLPPAALCRMLRQADAEPGIRSTSLLPHANHPSQSPICASQPLTSSFPRETGSACDTAPRAATAAPTTVVGQQCSCQRVLSFMLDMQAYSCSCCSPCALASGRASERCRTHCVARHPRHAQARPLDRRRHFPADP